jgi:hypothetical protein
VLCLRKCDAVKQNNVVESSARKSKSERVCMSRDRVGLVVGHCAGRE